MQNLKSLLSEVITAKPDVIQFAKDRKYEDAWIISVASARPTVDEIAVYLNKEAFEILIVEYIWNSTDDDKRFVLTLFLDKSCRLQDPEQFIKITLDLFYGYHSFKSCIETIDSQVIGSEYLLNTPVESVNSSVFNYWLSVGPEELWKKGEQYSTEAVKSKLLARPEILKTNLNYQGLLFRFNVDGNLNGPYYGIKTPCCNKIGDDWVMDFQKVGYWMNLLLGV